MEHILGIDVGTSNVKAVLFDENGTELHISSRESRTITGGASWAEQDMNAVWEEVKLCVKDVMAAEGVTGECVKGIGVTGQGEGCWIIDKNNEPLQNALLWCDGRAAEQVNKITRECPDIGELYHKTTGTPPLPGNQMMLIRWMKENRKEVLDKASGIVFCKDWIRCKMTGEVKTEITDSFTSLLNAETGRVADDLMKELDIYEYRHLIPDPVSSDTITGFVTEAFAAETGLAPGTPVVAGALDTSATAIGLGAIHKKDACVILGTTCACETVLKKEDCRFGYGNTRYEKHPIEDLYLELQPTLNGTPNIDWLLENISLTKDFGRIDNIIESVPAGCGGVVYHPYISPAGERAPFYHPYARAGFFGISQNTTREHLIRAVYEGVSLSVRDCLQGIDKEGTIYLAGGGAGSSAWAQMIADVMGMKVMIPSGKELGAKGVMIIAGVKLGIYSSYEDAVNRACTFRQTYVPDPEKTKIYDMLYDLYRSIRVSEEALWDKRHAMNKAIHDMIKEK